MKIVDEQIMVEFSAHGDLYPKCIAWRGSLYVVLRMLEEWKVCTKWWTREVERHYMVLHTDQFVMEVYRQDDRWKLYRLY